jgi:hypothetical protein
MSKITDITAANLADAELKVANTFAKVANTEENISKHLKPKTNKLLIIVAIALLVNLVLTVSLAGAIITLNDNAAKADELSAISSQIEMMYDTEDTVMDEEITEEAIPVMTEGQ